MLDVQNLSISIARENANWQNIVNNISFKIEAGEVLSIIGESGSGKTMTALSLLRLLPSKAAYHNDTKILLHGSDLLNITEAQMQKVRGADIAMIFQEPMNSLNPLYTAGQQILEVLKIHDSISGRYAKIEAMRLLEAVRILDPARCFEKYPHELSGGMQQRVMIAMALACKPSLLIADEPTTALDVTTQAKILELLRDLQRSRNMAMLLITHDLAIAAQMADRVMVMQNGNMVEQNRIKDFFVRPQTQYAQKLLDSTPSKLHITKTTTQNDQEVLSVNNLNVAFAVRHNLLARKREFFQAVDNVSFKMYKGQTLALVGESGSGKSTIAKAMLGLNNLAQGEVIYQDTNLLELNNKQWQIYRSSIQIIFQDPYSALDPKLTINTSLCEGMLLLNKYTPQELSARVDDLLISVGLKPEYKFRYPHEFSGGERQRICIARALSVDPQIIICDEPTSSLDVSVQAQILNLLLKLQRELQLTYLFITHDLNIVRLIADQVVVLQKGKVVEKGAVKQVLDAPQNKYTQDLLRAIPKIPTFAN